jgi:hypothetical protein
MPPGSWHHATRKLAPWFERSPRGRLTPGERSRMRRRHTAVEPVSSVARSPTPSVNPRTQPRQPQTQTPRQPREGALVREARWRSSRSDEPTLWASATCRHRSSLYLPRSAVMCAESEEHSHHHEVMHPQIVIRGLEARTHAHRFSARALWPRPSSRPATRWNRVLEKSGLEAGLPE